jgi:Family of unknown function (DUF5996)
VETLTEKAKGRKGSSWDIPIIIDWYDTLDTIHLWTQIIGKIRLAVAPKVNHWWHSTLYVTSRGLTTLSMPYGDRTFQINFDFLQHQLQIETSDGITKTIPLVSQSVASFYQAVMSTMKAIDIDIHIWTMPQEISEPIPFDLDYKHATYNSEYARKFWQILLQIDRVMTLFRSRYVGKCSPTHFFWGSFDLAVTRFSGKPAPLHPGGVPNMVDWVTQEAYSHELSSCGFWSGSSSIEPMFYSYAYPEPEGFKDYKIQPQSAFYNEEMKEFVLPYKAVQQADDPDDILLTFLQSTYEATANLGKWDRKALDYIPVSKY